MFYHLVNYFLINFNEIMLSCFKISYLVLSRIIDRIACILCTLHLELGAPLTSGDVCCRNVLKYI